METKTADLKDAKEFADAIHAVYPDAMLAYNLSPSFNWDTTGMSDDDRRRSLHEAVQRVVWYHDAGKIELSPSITEIQKKP